MSESNIDTPIYLPPGRRVQTPFSKSSKPDGPPTPSQLRESGQTGSLAREINGDKPMLRFASPLGTRAITYTQRHATKHPGICSHQSNRAAAPIFFCTKYHSLGGKPCNILIAWNMFLLRITHGELERPSLFNTMNKTVDSDGKKRLTWAKHVR